MIPHAELWGSSVAHTLCQNQIRKALATPSCLLIHFLGDSGRVRHPPAGERSFLRAKIHSTTTGTSRSPKYSGCRPNLHTKAQPMSNMLVPLSRRHNQDRRPGRFCSKTQSSMLTAANPEKASQSVLFGGGSGSRSKNQVSASKDGVAMASHNTTPFGIVRFLYMLLGVIGRRARRYSRLVRCYRLPYRCNRLPRRRPR